MNELAIQIIATVVKFGVLILGFALGLAGLLTWQERKQSSYMQDRIGPNRAAIMGIRLWGLPHFLADGIKMIFKEDVIPDNANKFLFHLAPILGLSMVLISLAMVPFGGTFNLFGTDIPMIIAPISEGILLIFALSGLSIYGGVLAGYSSDNKLGLLGSMRTSAQMISYEVTLGLTLVGIFMVMGSVRLDEIAAMQGGGAWGVFLQPFGFLLFFAAGIAETKRAPFDLPEGESEIVGYFLEYSGMRFGMFMFGEFVEIVLLGMLLTTMFFGSYHVLPWVDVWTPVHAWLVQTTGNITLAGLITAAGQFAVFATKVAMFCFIQLAIRWTLPRFRYDQVMHFGWLFLLPLSLLNLIVTAVIMLL